MPCSASSLCLHSAGSGYTQRLFVFADIMYSALQLQLEEPTPPAMRLDVCKSDAIILTSASLFLALWTSIRCKLIPLLLNSETSLIHLANLQQ